ncbi:hypothetical protein B0T25DRAFT_545945 [Lasiosphaeria hispida]|uniref:Nephrocystin 3-like N-terminal domain-containing protein n=1 Tax=Lasiosphaeria hispida TaxID=260671 RepID=A0AAJ0HJW7_9PEZI|nr:hypothetical protein B0T25DRAFT_545945 [Lasiosphaeria hispida]
MTMGEKLNNVGRSLSKLFSKKSDTRPSVQGGSAVPQLKKDSSNTSVGQNKPAASIKVPAEPTQHVAAATAVAQPATLNLEVQEADGSEQAATKSDDIPTKDKPDDQTNGPKGAGCDEGAVNRSFNNPPGSIRQDEVPYRKEIEDEGAHQKPDPGSESLEEVPKGDNPDEDASPEGVEDKINPEHDPKSTDTVKNDTPVQASPRDLWKEAWESPKLDAEAKELLKRPWRNPETTVASKSSESARGMKRVKTARTKSPRSVGETFASRDGLAAVSGTAAKDSAYIDEVIDHTRDRLAEYQRRWGSDTKGTAAGMARNVLTSALTAKELIDAGLKFDVSGYGACAWSVLSFGLTLVQNDKARMELSLAASGFLADLLARYAKTQTYYRKLSLEYAESQTKELEDAIVDVYIAILKYSAAVKGANEASVINRLIKSFHALTGQELTGLKNEIAEGEATVSKWQKNIDREYHAWYQKRIANGITTVQKGVDDIEKCIGEGITKIYQSVEEQANKIMDEVKTLTEEVAESRRALWQIVENHILQWLCKTEEDPSLEKHSKLRNAIERSETEKYQAGQWLLDWKSYIDWKANPQGVLWLHGPSGCGKSSLCSTIIKDLYNLCNNPNSQKVLVHWYFQFDKKDTKNIELPLRSFLRQLGSNGFPKEISTWLATESSRYIPPDKPTLITKLGHFIRELDKDIFMVLDGLDEFPKRSKDSAERKDILDLISELTQKSYPNLHLLLISKKEEDIEKHLEGDASLSQVLCSSDVGKRLQAELDTFINTTMEEKPEFSSLQETTRSDIRKRLNEGQDRIFLWVTSILDDLFLLGHDDDSVRKQLSRIPVSMATKYENALRSVDKEHEPFMRLILMWLLRHQRMGVPLTEEEIAAAVGLKDSTMVSTICTKTLVRTTKQSIHRFEGRTECTRIEFDHFSAKEYLEGLVKKTSEKGISRLSLSDEEIHQTITKQCLSTIISFDSGIGQESALMGYAANYWFKHYLLLKPTQTDDFRALQSFVIDLFQSNNKGFESWKRFLDPDKSVHSSFDMQQGSSIANDLEAGPIYYAVKIGVFDIATRLINGKCPQGLPGKEGTALELALFRKQWEIATAMINNSEHGADLIVLRKGPHGSPLYIASAHGRTDIVTALLQKGAKANLTDEGKFGSALHAAAFYGKIDVVKELLKPGPGNEAAVDQSGGIYGTALQLATAKGNGEMVRLLFNDYKASATAVDSTSLFGNALQAAWALDRAISKQGLVRDPGLVDWQAAYMRIQEYGDRLVERYDAEILPTPMTPELRDSETGFSRQQQLLIRVLLSRDLSANALSLAEWHNTLTSRFPYKSPLEERLAEINDALSCLAHREADLARRDFLHRTFFQSAVKYVLENLTPLILCSIIILDTSLERIGLLSSGEEQRWRKQGVYRRDINGESIIPYRRQAVFSRVSLRGVSEWNTDTEHIFEFELSNYGGFLTSRDRVMALDDLVSVEFSKQQLQLRRESAESSMQPTQLSMDHPTDENPRSTIHRLFKRQERRRETEQKKEDLPPIYLIVDDLLSLLRDLIHYSTMCDTAHDALRGRGRKSSPDHARETVDDLTFEVFAAVLRLALAIKTRNTPELWKTISLLKAARQPRMARLAQICEDLLEQWTEEQTIYSESHDFKRTRPDRMGQRAQGLVAAAAAAKARSPDGNHQRYRRRDSARIRPKSRDMTAWETEDDDDVQVMIMR